MGFEPITFVLPAVRSSQANWELIIVFVHNKPIELWINDCGYMKIIYVNCGLINGYESDLSSNEQHLIITSFSYIDNY